MKYNTLVLDCDGTLLNSNGKIDPKTKEALIKFQEKGHRLILASGRPALGMEKFIKELQMDKFDSHYISFNGAEIYSAKNNKKIYEDYLKLDEQKAIYEFILREGLVILTYHKENILLSSEGPYVHEEHRMTGMNEVIDSSYFSKNTYQHAKIMGVGDSKIVTKFEELYRDGFTKHTAITTSQPYFLEFINSSVSKGIALTFLTEHLNFSLEETIGVGDSNNDISLLQTTAKGIAVKNGTDSLLSVADEIVESNNDLGVMNVVHKYFTT